MKIRRNTERLKTFIEQKQRSQEPREESNSHVSAADCQLNKDRGSSVQEEVALDVELTPQRQKPQTSYASVLNKEVVIPSTESLKCLLDEAESVKFVVKDDSPCLVYKKRGSDVDMSAPIKVLNSDSPTEEYDLKYIKSCKDIKFFWNHNTGDPCLSVQNGKFRFPTPIALRTRTRLKEK